MENLCFLLEIWVEVLNQEELVFLQRKKENYKVDRKI